MPERAVYRVTFTGDELEPPSEFLRLLSLHDIALEGSETGRGPAHHRVLARAASPQGAIAAVRKALSGSGTYGDFAAAPVRDARGNVWRGTFYRRWDEVEWEHPPERAAITELQRDVLRAMADSAEPTVLVVREVRRPASLVEQALRELREQGLVSSHTEPFWDSQAPDEQAQWWKLTDKAWELLGFIKSPGYR